MMNWKGFVRKWLRTNLRYYPGIRLEGAEENYENLSQDSRYPGRYFNPRPPEYEAGVLTTRPRRMVYIYVDKRQRCLYVGCTWCEKRYVKEQSFIFKKINCK
jgi:hypothetical protein